MNIVHNAGRTIEACYVAKLTVLGAISSVVSVSVTATAGIGTDNALWCQQTDGVGCTRVIDVNIIGARIVGDVEVVDISLSGCFVFVVLDEGALVGT